MGTGPANAKLSALELEARCARLEEVLKGLLAQHLHRPECVSMVRLDGKSWIITRRSCQCSPAEKEAREIIEDLGVPRGDF